MKRIVFFPIYLMTTILCLSQPPEQIKFLLNKSSQACEEFKNYNQSIQFAKEAKVLSLKQNDFKNLGQSYLQLGIAFEMKKEIDSSFINYQNALEIFYSLNEKHALANTYNSIERIMEIEGQYRKALIFTQKAINIWLQDSLQYHLELIKAFNNSANIYEGLYEIDSAILFNQKALYLSELHNDTSGLAKTYHGLGNRYSNQENYPIANSNYRLAQKFSQTIGNKELEAMILEGLGLNAMDVDSNSLSKKYFLECENILLELKDSLPLPNIYYNLSTLCENTGALEEGLSYSQKAANHYLRGDTDLKLLIDQQTANLQSRLLEKQRANLWLFVTILIFIGLFLFYLWLKRKKELDKELQLTKMEREALATEKELITTKENLIHQQELNAKKEREGIEVRKELLEHQERLIVSEKEALETRKKLTSERDKFNRIKHSKVKNQTIIIKNIIEAIKNNTDNENLSKAKINVDYLVHITEKSWDEIEQLNKFNKPKKLKAFAEDMLWKAKMLSLLEVELISEFDDIGDLLLKSDVQTIADEIIGNAFINICKHAECENPQLIFSADDRGLIIEIIDDGKGFDMEKIRVGAQGLKDMETAANSIGGTVKITSKINVGTQIKIILPTPFYE